MKAYCNKNYLDSTLIIYKNLRRKLKHNLRNNILIFIINIHKNCYIKIIKLSIIIISFFINKLFVV